MERLHSDPKFRMIHNLRARLHAALGAGKEYGTRRLVGCSLDELKAHLESRFQPGMSWDNYGAWHIDHVVPLVRANLDDPVSVAMICHYTNLQPLWAQDNLKKGCK